MDISHTTCNGRMRRGGLILTPWHVIIIADWSNDILGGSEHYRKAILSMLFEVGHRAHGLRFSGIFSLIGRVPAVEVSAMVSGDGFK
jgi:hypothetical protein